MRLSAPLLGLLLLTACRPAEEAASSKPDPAGATPLDPAQRLDEADALLWAPEVEARFYEAALVRWTDALRQAPDKAGALSQLSFDTLTLPQPTTPAHPLDATLGISEQRFDDAQSVDMNASAWTNALARFQAAGWSLDQMEWQHEKFWPARKDQPPQSWVAFELHGQQAAQSHRFILQGQARIFWKAPTENGWPRAARIGLHQLSLLERTGPPAFDNTLVVAPEPESPHGQVNLHPLIVSDLNGDSHADILLPAVNKALLNDGQAGFTTESWVSPAHYYALGEAGVLADFTGDGLPDYVGMAEAGPYRRLLTLLPGGPVPPWTEPPRAAWEEQRSHYDLLRFDQPSACTAGDVDADGDLDLFVAQYRPPYIEGNLPTPYYDANDGYPSRLLLNDGSGQFKEAPVQSGLQAKNRRRTLAASLVDLDQDGDLDLVTLNDFSGVDLFLNDGLGRFTDATPRLGPRHLFGMGHLLADFNRDGRLDLFAIGMDVPTVRRLEALGLGHPQHTEETARRVEMGHGNRLYLGTPQGWTQPPWADRLARSGWSWGGAAFDPDNDADLDLYIANGHVSGASAADYDSHYWTRDIYLARTTTGEERVAYFESALSGLNSGNTSWNGYQHNVFLLDSGDHHYTRTAYLLGLAHESDCRVVVAADLDSDGRVDLLLTEVQWLGSPNRLQHRLLIHLNRMPRDHHWIGLKLTSAAPGGVPPGTKVWLEQGVTTRVHHIVTGDSFQAQSPTHVHFGLGDVPRVEMLRVEWPDGRVDPLPQPAPDRYHLLAR